MDGIIKYLLNQGLGSTKGPLVYDIYVALKSNNAQDRNAAILAVISYIVPQLLGTARGATVMAQINAAWTLTQIQSNK